MKKIALQIIAVCAIAISLVSCNTEDCSDCNDCSVKTEVACNSCDVTCESGNLCADSCHK